MTRCECCDLPVEMCGKAAEQRQRQEAADELRQLLDDGWLTASFAGKCGSCGEFFPIGSPIANTSAGYVSSCCKDKIPATGRNGW